MTIKNSVLAMGMAVHGTHSANQSAESKNKGSQKPFYNTKPPLPTAGELLYDVDILNVLREYFPNFRKLGAVFQGQHSNRVNIYRHNGLYLAKDFTGKEFGDDKSRNTLQIIRHYHQCDFKEALAILLEKLGYTATRQQAPLRQKIAPGTKATVRQEDPTPVTGKRAQKQYTVGLSKYIVGHSLKVQGDVTLQQQERRDDVYQFRLQMEVAL